jgi:hypothetical protein
MPWALRQAAFTGRSLDLKQSQPQLNTDISRLKQGKVGAQVPPPRASIMQSCTSPHPSIPQFWSVWVPASLDDSQAVAVTLEQISRVWQLQQLCASPPSPLARTPTHNPRSLAALPPPPTYTQTQPLMSSAPPRCRYPHTFKVCLSAADVDAAAASIPPKIASLIGMEGGHSIGNSIDTLAAMYEAACSGSAAVPQFNFINSFLQHNVFCLVQFDCCSGTKLARGT